jgi:hypothetical protein
MPIASGDSGKLTAIRPQPHGVTAWFTTVRRFAALLLAVIVTAPLHASGEEGSEQRRPASIQGAVIEGTRIRVQKPDGSWATRDELIGATLVAHDEGGVRERYRIDAVEEYESEQTGRLLFYQFSVQNPETGNWENFCKPDRKGRQLAFPMAGYWDETGRHVRSANDFSITCTAGTIGKCVLFGYLPWSKSAGGSDPWRLHQACVRMIRADYCGNGNPHTREGTLIEIWDREGIQIDTSVPNLTFEAAWNDAGAVCIERTRIAEVASEEQILAECPEKLVGRIGAQRCHENFDDPSVLILNRSLAPSRD